MEFKIEGNSIQFDIEVSDGAGITIGWVVSMAGGEWRANKGQRWGSSWLAQSRTPLHKVVERALLELELEVINERVRQRNNP